MVTTIYTGDPLVGTANDDYLIGSRGPTGTPNNTIVAGGGDDLAFGDIDTIGIITSATGNNAFGAEYDLDAMASLWTTGYNPLVGSSATPHATLFVESTHANEWQYYKVHLNVGQTLTVDVDFGANTAIGSGAATFIGLYSGGGSMQVAADRDSLPTDGGAGSFAGAGGTSDDAYLTYTASTAGDYTIVLRRDDPQLGAVNFQGNESFVLNVSVTGHATVASSAPGNDNIQGGTGDDFLFGCGGNDTISGGDDNDYIDGGIGVETLHGDHGDDIIRSSGDGSVFGDDGNDLIYAGDTDESEMLDGGIGTDTLDVSGFDFATTYMIDLSTGLTNFAGESFVGFENLVSGASIDTITGTAAANVIRTGDGGDTLNGGNGNDVLEGEAGNDMINGDANFDYASYEHATGGVSVSLAIMGIQNTGSAGNDTLTGIEGLIGSASTSFTDILTGNGADNILIGLDGSNQMDGGGGNDTVSYARASQAVTVDLNNADGQIVNGFIYDTLTSIENLIGSDFGDRLTGNGVANTLDGGIGSDTLAGGAGNDLLIGGIGNNFINGGADTDTVSYAGSEGAVTVDLRLTTQQIINVATTDMLTNIENVIGTVLNDTLTGDGSANVLTGGDGNDVLDGGDNNDTLDGGIGNDTASYASALAAVRVNLALTTAQATGGAGTDRLVAIENVTGSAFDDTLTGTVGQNLIHGGDGNDIIDGGANNDRLYGDNGIDTVTYASAASAVAVNLAIVTSQNTGGSGFDTLNGIENLIGSSGGDTLTGNGYANIITGGAGDDTLDGAGGNDTASYANATGGVTASLATTAAQATGGAGTDHLANFENLTGSRFSDTLTGNGGANIITGGAGNDVLDGGGGTDTVSYDDATAAVTVSLAKTGNQATGYGTDRLTNFENLTGSRFGDHLTGNSGDNVITGGTGNDVLDGGGGTDTAAFANAAAGVKVSLAVTGNQATGAGTDQLTNFENLLGSAYADILTGSTGDNRLDGAAGDDALNGGLGTDVLVGGNGHDLFVFTTALGSANVDTISGFVAADDTIQLSHSIFAGLAVGALDVGAYNTGATASQADDRILYDASTGALLFDRDGSGTTYDAVQFATTTAGLTLSSLDFVVI